MARAILPLTISDVSVFAKALRSDLIKRGEIPGHAAFLTAISKAAGFENHQHLRAQAPGPIDPHLTKAKRAFDKNGIMHMWPKQTTIQGMCLWVFWARIPARTDLTEKDINAVLIDGSSFGDHPLLRRSMIDHKLLTRTTDGRVYRRIEQTPSEAAKQLITELS
jgi:hypothetical protein